MKSGIPYSGTLRPLRPLRLCGEAPFPEFSIRSLNPVYRNRIFFLCLLILTPLAFSMAVQDQRAVLKLTGAARIETPPGKILTVGVRISNPTSLSQRYEPYVVLPKGWRSFTRLVPFELSPKAEEIKLISISIPSEAPVGEYEVRVGVKDGATTSGSEVTIAVNVLAVRQLDLRVIESPRFVVAGDRYKIVFALTNKSNVDVSARLTARSSNGFTVEVESVLVRLRPKETRTIALQVTTDSKIIGRVQDIIELNAGSVEDANVTIRLTNAVEVIPRVSGVEDRFYQFPLLAKVRAAGEQGSYGTQFELWGSGSISEASKDRLDIFIRTPDIQPKSILGQRDEYRLSLRGEQYEVYAGDRNFMLSSLTELARYGFGAGGKVTVGDVSAGGFFNESRFLLPKQKQQAGFLSYQVHKSVDVGINYLRKEEQGKSDVFSLRSLIRPFENSELDLEYGRGGMTGALDNAYSARISGNARWIAYDARYVHAGANYTGYYKDLDFKTFNFNVIPSENIRLEGYFRLEDRNLNRDTARYYAPRDLFYQFGVGYSDYVTVLYRFNEQRDLLPDPKYQRSENLVQLRTGYRFSKISLLLNTDFGSSEDKLLQKESPFQRYSLFTSVRPAEDQSYSVALEYSRDKNLFTDEAQKRYSASLSVWMMVSQRTQLIGSVYASRTEASTVQTYNLIDVTLEHAFTWGHKLAVRGRQSSFTPSSEGKEFAYLVEYAIPIGVPVSRIRTSGQLRGTIVDVETGRGIADVVMYAGSATAITDGDGDFFFPSLKPNTYYLQIDMASIGLNRVPSQPMPKEIVVKGGEEARVDLGVIRSAAASGTVTLFSFAEGAPTDSAQVQYVELGGHPNVVLELASGTEILRRVSDNRGRFVFADLRPGQWTLRVLDANLPANHFVEKETFDFTIKPGEKQDVALKVLPRRRRIQILREGKVLQETKLAEQQKPDLLARKNCVVVALKDQTGFVAQLSAWATEQEARRAAQEAEKLTRAKVSVQKLPVGGFEVHVGVFKSRQEAEAACRKLQTVR